MLLQIRIAPRLIAVFVLWAVVLLIIGGAAARGMLAAADYVHRVDRNFHEQTALGEMNHVLRVELPAILDDVLAARLTWEQGRSDVLAMKNLLSSQWDEYRREKTAEEIAALDKTLALTLGNVDLAFGELDQLLVDTDASRLAVWRYQSFANLTRPFTTAGDERSAQQRLNYEAAMNIQQRAQAWYLYGGMLALAAALAMFWGTGKNLYVLICHRLRVVDHALRDVLDGRHESRTGIRGGDEIGTLAQSVDQILDEQQATLRNAALQQEQLNASLAMVLQAISELGARDYLARAPATDDATAPLADAVNRLADDTGQMLTNIRRIAEQMAKTSAAAHADADVMITVAENEQHRVLDTTPLLQLCDNALQETATAMHGALDLVRDTTACLGDVTATVRDSQLQAIRVDGQAQEAGTAINELNGLSERAHIISVNAGIQVMAGGDANRNATTTAAELQRLTEKLRDTTRHVAALLVKIQRAAQDQSSLLDSAMSQLNATTQIARHTGDHLGHVHQYALESVAKLQTTAIEHKQASELGAMAGAATTNDIHAHLIEHRRQTQRLTHFSRGLLTAIKSFSLPAESAGAKDVPLALTDAATTAMHKQAS